MAYKLTVSTLIAYTKNNENTGQLITLIILVKIMAVYESLISAILPYEIYESCPEKIKP